MPHSDVMPPLRHRVKDPYTFELSLESPALLGDHVDYHHSAGFGESVTRRGQISAIFATSQLSLITGKPTARISHFRVRTANGQQVEPVYPSQIIAVVNGAKDGE